MEKNSLFSSILSKNSVEITFFDFIQSVRSSQYQPQVELYRQLMAQGKKAEADHVKRRLPAISTTATFQGGHSIGQLQAMNGLASLDLDHTLDRTEEIFRLLCALPYVRACFRTVSGQGLKVFIRINARTPEEYPAVYAAIADQVCAIVNFLCDKQCSDVTRLCFGSFDPQAYYNPHAELFPYEPTSLNEPTFLNEPTLSNEPTFSNESTSPNEPMSLNESTFSIESTFLNVPTSPNELTSPNEPTPTNGSTFPNEPTSTNEPTFSNEPPFPNEPKQVGAEYFPPSESEHTGLPRQNLLAFLEEFLQYNPFRRGDRHKNMLKLGRKAASKNISEKELEKLMKIACEKLAKADYSETKMRQDIVSGYQYVKGKEREGVVSCLTMRHENDESGEFDKILLSENNQKIQADLPYFPEEVYKALPDLLKRSLAPMPPGRARDFLLGALMANLSASVPKTRFQYDRLIYSPHFYFAAVSSAGSGKGSVALAAGISYHVHKYLLDRSTIAWKEYKRQLRVYELEQNKAWKAQKEFTQDPPEEPKRVVLQIPGNCSKASLVQILQANGEQGAVINASEINTLVAVMGQDFGKMDDLFCAATHHEDYGRSFKIDGETHTIEEVRLALCVSGTLQQFIDFVRSPENGFHSRISVLTSESQTQFHSCEPRKGEVDLKTHLREMGKEVLDLYQTLIQMPETRVEFTHEQWDRHTAYFQHCLLTIRFEGEEDSTAVVFRFALLVMRLASIFTVLRKWEDKLYSSLRYCSDEDFDAAMAMVEVLMKHTLLLGTMLPPVPKKKLSSYHQILQVIQSMSIEFTAPEFEKKTSHLGISRATSYRWLMRAVHFQFVVREGNKYRKNLVDTKNLSHSEM